MREPGGIAKLGELVSAAFRAESCMHFIPDWPTIIQFAIATFIISITPLRLDLTDEKELAIAQKQHPL